MNQIGEFVAYKIKPTVKTLRQADNGRSCTEFNEKKFLYPYDLPEEEIIFGTIPENKILEKGYANIKKYWADQGLELVPYAYAYLAEFMFSKLNFGRYFNNTPNSLLFKHIIAYTKHPRFKDYQNKPAHLAIFQAGSSSTLFIFINEDEMTWHGRCVFVLRKTKKKWFNRIIDFLKSYF